MKPRSRATEPRQETDRAPWLRWWTLSELDWKVTRVVFWTLAAGSAVVMFFHSAGTMFDRTHAYHEHDRSPAASRPSFREAGESEVRAYAKKCIEAMVRDPSAVKYHSMNVVNLRDVWVVKVDFTATNGFGGPERANWNITVNKASGTVTMVYDAIAGKTF